MKIFIPKALFIFIIILIGTIIAGAYFMFFHENPPVEFLNMPFPVDKEVYSSGDSVVITVDYCRYTNEPFVSHISFVDGLVFMESGCLDDLVDCEVAGAPTGCGTIVGQATIIPDQLLSGEYYILGRNIYKVNPFAIRTVEWRTESFMVDNK